MIPPFGVVMLREVWVQRPTRVKQDCPYWCWAASTSMIFACNDHPTNQMRIVERVFNQPLCIEAQSAILDGVLSTNWLDDRGQEFRSVITGLYDLQNHINSINNSILVNELQNNRPLLYANTHHAMVIVGLKYFDTPFGPSVTEVTVLDPSPSSPAIHPLSAAELYPVHLGGQMQFLASVQVTS
jgi:hypothetical protein